MDSFPSSNNGAAALSYLTYGTQDPTVTPTNGTPGLLFIRVGRVANGKIGAVGLYQKITTAGKDTNWQMFGSGSNAYAPSVPADWDNPVPTNVPSALDQLALRVTELEGSGIVPNFQQIYVDANIGSDADGDGSIAKPYQSINHAITFVTNPGDKYVLILGAGDYTGDPVSWPGNASMIGQANTVSVQQTINYVSEVGSEDTPVFMEVGFNSFTVDLTEGTLSLLTFNNCGINLERLDNEPPGPKSITFNHCYINNLIARGTNILNDCLFTGTADFKTGSTTLCNGCVIGQANTIEGSAILDLNGSIFVGSFTGTSIGPDTPIIRANSSALNSTGVITGCIVQLTDDAEFTGYTPSNPGAWPVVPDTVKEALDTIQSQMGVIGPIQDVVYVAKNGSDVTGDGGIDKPYLTVLAAMNSITANSPTRRHVIFVMPGRYDEVGLTLKPNVFIVGYDYFTTRISNTIPFAPDASFSVAGDHRSGFVNINIATAINMNFSTVSSNEGKFYIKNCQITAGYSFTAFSNINQSFVENCDIFGGIAQTGGTILVEDCNIFSGGVTIAPRVGGNTSFQGLGCVNSGNFTVNGNGVDPIAVSLYQFNVAGSFTADGAAVTVQATVDSLPPTSSFLNSAVKTLLSKSQNVDYAPAAPGSWPVVPANVKDALDELITLVGGSSVLPLSNVVYVAKNGNDGTADGSIAKPFLTIQAAINSTGATVVNSPKVILIAPGVYTENFIQIRPNMYLVALARGSVSIVNSVTFGINQSIASGAFNGGTVGLIGIRVTSPVYEMSTTNGTSFTVRCIDCEFNGSMLFFGAGPAHVFYSQNCVYQNPTSTYTLRIRSCYFFSTNDKITYFEQYHESLDANPRLKSEFMGSEITTFAGNGNGVPLLESTVVLNSSPVGAFTGASFLLQVRASVDSLDSTSGAELGAILTLTSLSENVGYTPADAGNWPVVPANAKAALDSLAARATVVEERSISAGEAAAKQLTLNSTPYNVNNVSVSFMGVEQTDSVDFSVTGSIVGWNGLGLDSIGVAAGDVMVITYEKQ